MAVEAPAEEYDTASDLGKRASEAEHSGDFHSSRYEASHALGLTAVPPAVPDEDPEDPEEPEAEDSEDL
ncbi:hypothetical protein [Streptomyces sp. NPDC059909]|uniref:hypothetical protein n=1 Tax=Streptomyces sp. NPDC059909 TaxID=3346998 RepID=UPI00364B4552